MPRGVPGKARETREVGCLDAAKSALSTRTHCCFQFAGGAADTTSSLASDALAANACCGDSLSDKAVSLLKVIKTLSCLAGPVCHATACIWCLRQFKDLRDEAHEVVAAVAEDTCLLPVGVRETPEQPSNSWF